MTTPLLLALALAAAPGPAAAAPSARHPLGLDDLMALERLSDLDLSPDGRWLALSVSKPTADGARLTSWLALQPAAGGPSRRLTFGDDRPRSPRFAPDGRTLAFVAARGGGPGQLFLLPLEGGGEAAPAPRVPGGVGAFRWLPDGSGFLVTAEVDPACGADLACNERADEAARGKPYRTDRLLFRHWDEWRTRKRVHVLRVPLDGAPVDLTPGDRDVPPAHRGGLGDVVPSPDGKTVFLVAMADPVEATSTNADVFALPLAGGPLAPVTRAPGWDGAPRPSPDGRRLAWLRMPRAGYEADRRHLLVAAADGSGERDLTAALDVSADSLWWTGDGKALRFTATQDGLSEVWEVRASGSAPPARLWRGPHLGGAVPSRDGRTLAVLTDSMAAPAEAGLLAPARGGGLALTVLTRLGAAVLDQVALGEARRIQATGKDGAAIHGWLLTPPGHRPGERHPGVVLVHGGPQGAWNDAWSFRWNPQLWAARGWTVVMPNPRGSTGFGQAYTDAVRDDWGGTPYDDIMRLTDAAIASGELDGDHTCAAGASYGGTMVNWINGQTDRFRCLVSHAGWFDLAAGYTETEELWFPEWELGIPWERPEAYARWSPSTFVKAWKTPTLVTHGELDYRVTVTQGLATYTALQRRGVESRLVVFPDENHWVLKPRNSRLWHEEVFGWIERHLAPGGGGAPPGAPR